MIRALYKVTKKHPDSSWQMFNFLLLLYTALSQFLPEEHVKIHSGLPLQGTLYTRNSIKVQVGLQEYNIFTLPSRNTS